MATSGLGEEAIAQVEAESARRSGKTDIGDQGPGAGGIK